jgi:hypothetical protein
MLSSPVYAKLQSRTDLPFARTRRAPIFPFLIHPLCFQTLPHSFAQWTTPISFSFNRFHTLSTVMGGGGYAASKNLNHHFNVSPNSPQIQRTRPLFSSILFNVLRTLSFSASPKPCICHSYENTRGVCCLFPERNSLPPCLRGYPASAGQSGSPHWTPTTEHGSRCVLLQQEDQPRLNL